MNSMNLMISILIPGISRYSLIQSIKHINISMLILVITVYILAVTNICMARDIIVSWDFVADPQITGYNIYYKKQSFQLPFDGTEAVQGISPIDAGNNYSIVLNGLTPNINYYISAKSYSVTGAVSDYSPIIEVNSQNVFSGIISIARNSITSSLNTLPSGDNLNVFANELEYIEDLTLNRCGEVIQIHGGYDSSYSSQTGYTIIKGSLNVKCGTLIVNRIIIQ
jgi:hypothetical protein